MHPETHDSSPNLYQLPELTEQDELMEFPVPDLRRVRSRVHHPVARVLVDAPGAYWGATFDYEVPEELDENTTIGCRVRVVFGHKKAEGFVVQRLDFTRHSHRIKPIEKVISSFCSLDPVVYRLCTRMAHEQACTVMDVVRCAVPARHARAEREVLSLPPVRYKQYSQPYSGIWNEYEGGSGIIRSLMNGHVHHRFCTIAPAHTDAQFLCAPIKTQLVNARSVLIIVPTPREAYSLASELHGCLKDEPIIVFTAEASREQRYRNFVGIAQGRARVVIGTRSACFAPIKNLGLIALIDPKHVAHREQRVPYYHALHVVEQRADIEGCSVLVCERGPDVYAAYKERCSLADSRIRVRSERRRELMPRIIVNSDMDREGSLSARIPESMFTVVREGLNRGHVLVVVPISGYMPVILCAECGTRVRCKLCHGFLEVSAPHEPPQCVRCGVRVDSPQCQNCASTNIKALRIGSLRTAQEIGRAFLGVPIVAPSRAAELTNVPKKPSIIVATPGSIPACGTLCAAGVLLDVNYMLQSHSLDAEARTLGMIAQVAHHVHARAQGGQLLIVGDLPYEIAMSARTLIWNEWERATLAERESLRLPPSATWISCEGTWPHIKDFLSLVRLAILDVIHQSHNHGDSEPLYASREELGDTQTPLDSLLSGGVHSLIPYMTILGPLKRADGTVLIYLRCEHQQRRRCIQAVRRALQETAIRRIGTHVRVHVDPAF